MVTIKYYADPSKEPEIHECDSVLDFLLPRFTTRDQLLDLRFFDSDLLCDEIDQTGGDFLEINEGVVAITHDSMIPRAAFAWYVVVAVIAAVAVVALTPRPEVPQLGRDQQSGTNSLGDSSNEPRINQRIDDIFGTVNKHVPSLWQVPYRIGINNQEAEVLLCCVGRGRYQIDPNKWYDGDTPVVNIPNAAVNIYRPQTNPVNGDTPDTVIGYNITEKVGIYRQSNDLNPSELQPPNALENSGIIWKLSGGAGSTAIMSADFIPNGFDFTSFYKVGDKITLSDMYYFSSAGAIPLYIDDSVNNSDTGFIDSTNPDEITTSNPNQTITTSIPVGAIEVTDGTNTYSNTSVIEINTSNSISTTIPSEQITVAGETGQIYNGYSFKIYNPPVDLGQNGSLEYEILSVTSNTITLAIPFDAPSVVINAWAAMTNYYLKTFAANITYTGSADRYVFDEIILSYNWFFLSGVEQLPVTVVAYNYNPIAGAFFDNTVGPLFIPEGSTEVIINLTSSNGFYKLDENSEVAVTTNILFKIYELDNNGDETGNITPTNVVYSSNPDSITQPVFETVRLNNPYTKAKLTAERTSKRDKGKSISNVDKVEFRDFYTFEPVGKSGVFTYTGNTFSFSGNYFIDDIPPSVFDQLDLSLGVVDAGKTIRIIVESQGVDEVLTIQEITTFGVSNYSIRFTSVPVGGVTENGITISIDLGNRNIDFGDVTIAHVIIPSNSTSQLIKQRKQNVDLTRLVTQYLGNGNFGPAESYATDLFDQIIIHMSLDPRIGRLSLDNINADGYIDIRNEMISYFGSDEMCKFGYDFDSVSLTFQDTYMLIADAVMCRPYVQYGVYDLFFEKAQTVSTMQVTCRNKVFESEARRTIERKHDGVELTYRSNVTSAQETIYVPSDQSATNPLTLDIKGITNELQATRRAKREYNKLLYKLESVQFEVDEFGRNIIPYKRIDSPDSTRFTKRADTTDGYRVYEGEVIEVNGLQVELSEPVEFVEGEDHYITFTKANGNNSEIILCTQIDEFNVLLSTLPSESIYDGYQKDRTKFILVSEQLRDSVALIPETIEFRLDDNNVETHSVKLVNYTDKYYQNDLDTLE